MPTWNEILENLNIDNNPNGINQISLLRKEYINKLASYRNRNIIVYYSGWLEKPNTPGVNIDDIDMNGFMSAVNKLDKTKGLDVILHTPGGNPTATEHIVNYLHSIFKDINVIVPYMAMSAGTMFACASSVIIMGKQSCLGPVDPQFNGIAAFNIHKEFMSAKEDLTKNPKSIEYWKQLISKYPAAFVYSVLDAINLSKVLVKTWLKIYMFKDDNDGEKKIAKIIKVLNSNKTSKSHSRHFPIEFCKQIGLKIIELENDNKLQDLVLSIYHICNITISRTNAIKIIENQNGKDFIVRGIPNRF